MANTDVISVPPRTSINTGLDSPGEAFMLNLLGPPAATKTVDCNNDHASPRLANHLISAHAGPLHVTGFYLAVQSLQEIFTEVKLGHPRLLDGLRDDSMLCIRKVRGGSHWSNHAFGCAIDLKYTDGGIDQGDPRTFQGLQDLYFYFHKHKWYWGAGFTGGRVDAMHFEASKQLLNEWESAHGPF